MDYIRAGLLDTISLLKNINSPDVYSTIAQYYRMLMEYHLMLMFSCQWALKEITISRESRSSIVHSMSKPVLGTTLSYIMQMNSEGKPIFDLDSAYESVMREFINVRNKCFGHGIVVPKVQEQSYQEICDKLEKQYKKIADFEKKFWGEDCEFMMRRNAAEQAQITVFLPNRRLEYRDIEPSLALDYQRGELYFSCDAGNLKVSPFIIAREINLVRYDFYYFTEYKLQSEKFDYCLVSEIRDDYTYSKTFRGCFTSYRQISKYTICRANGVVSNRFENNYDYFVDIPPFSKHVTLIWDFLIKNQSNTCLTIRGGGGIGKTALVHYICTKYLFETLTSEPKFNFVIFCSAKDREFRLNRMTGRGQIYLIEEEKVIHSYQDILRTVGRVLELNALPDTDEGVQQIEDA